MTRDGRILQLLLQLTRAKVGDSALELWRYTEEGRRCRLCNMLIGTPQGTGTGFVAKMHWHRQAQGNDKEAAYLIDNDLHVLNHKGQERLRRLDLGRGTLCDVGAKQACGVLVGPKWFKDLLRGWCHDTLIHKVIKRVVADPEFLDALIAVSDLADVDAVDVLVAHQFPDEMFYVGRG